MSWRDSLLPAKFRGVPFQVQAHEGTLGRRVQVHEFPFRDLPFVEDLGRATRGFKVDAFVLGEDYPAVRDRLMAAAETKGPGQLVHPYLGEMTVSCMKVSLRETTAEGGMARLTLEFIESGDSRFPATDNVTGAAVLAAGNRASAAAQSSFAARHSVAGKPQFVTQASGSIFKSALGAMSGAVGKVRAAADEVAALERQVTTARNDVTTLLFEPASAAQALVSSLQQLTRKVVNAPRDAWNVARIFYRFGGGLAVVTGSTASRAAQARNQAEMVQLVRVAAASESARALTRVAFESYQEAAAARDEISDALDDALLQASTDELYDALRALRAATVRDVAVRGADLARLVSYTPLVTLPALRIAQDVYGDAARYDELVLRNRVRNPLLVPGQHALEVLADG